MADAFDRPRPFDWIVTPLRDVYENPWIHVSLHDVVMPGNVRRTYTLLHMKKRAVGVVALDAAGWTWLVGQQRFPFRAWSWEVPEGGVEPGENLLDAARRELAEEVGVTCTDWREVLTLHLSNMISDETATGYLATGAVAGKAAPEESEQLDVQHLPFAEVAERVLDGSIKDAITVALVLKLQAMARREMFEPWVNRALSGQL